jgi:hypothetical protein
VLEIVKAREIDLAISNSYPTASISVAFSSAI